MRRSIFSKFFMTQVMVAITVIVLIVPMIFLLIGEYFLSAQKEDILQDATRVASLTAQIADVGTDEVTWEFFRSGIEFAGRQSSVLVVNSKGMVIAAPKNFDGADIGKIDEKFISSAREGRSTVSLYGKGNIFREQMIVAMTPIVKTDVLTGQKSFLGASIAMRPVPQIRGIQNRIISIILMAQIIAWMVAFVVSFLMTRHITKPIKKMRNAAKSIAAGNFNERIPITTSDEIGELAKSFNSMTQSLSELEDMRTSFLSDVSHELRTPMTIISGFVEGILDGTISESEHRKYLDIVSSEAKRLSRLVHDLLEATRLDQGKIKMEKIPFDINRLTTETIISYENSLTQKNINVDLDFEEDCVVFADKDSIKRVLINLIDNAIKFTPKDGNISVKTRHWDKKIKVSVQNSGDGISEDDLRHIWERFYKSDKSRGIDKKGVGLGLHIVKTIISQHGGEIYAESNEGEFARFTFVLDESNKNSVSYDNGKGE